MGQGSIVWFARHELRLAWRDGLAMLRGGRRRSLAWTVIALAVAPVALHLVAYGVLDESVAGFARPDKALLLAATGAAFLSWTLLLSQAMETATRALYARADLDLILSSPAPARRLFAVRIGAIAVSAIVMATMILGPFIDVAAFLGGWRYLCAYGVLVAMGCLAASVAVGLTIAMFRAFGPKRTRFLAQVAAAIVGAGFVIGVQAGAILSYGSFSRTSMFRSPQWIAAAPGLDSFVWWPARAAMGDAGRLAFVLGVAFGLLVLTMLWGARSFPRIVLTVAGLAQGRGAIAEASVDFRIRSSAAVLRRKEWLLLRRDPWLVSQSLMQVLYLLPPALMLWRNFGSGLDKLAVLVPVLVMAAGQLGGGLAWLALSGEDAPDLVATAPVPPRAVLRAKIEAVMIAVALPVLPLALAMAWLSPFVAATTILGSLAAAAGASAVQLFFRTNAKRSSFRRRQTSSRVATFAEALLSISVAAGAGLAAAGLWLAVLPMAAAAGVLLGSRLIAGPVAV